jgi:hypothetical protein
MSLGDVAADFGKGMFAGVAGTAAMTVSSTLEMKLSGRPASQTPAEAAEKVLQVEPVSEDAEARFSNLVHWGYGTGRRARPRGHPGPPRAGMGRGAGRPARPRRLRPGLQIRRKSDRHRSPAPSTPPPRAWPTPTCTAPRPANTPHRTPTPL